MDFNPLHMDAEYAKSTPFGQRIVYGMLGASISSGLTNFTGIMSNTAIALMEITFQFKAPILFGDTVHCELIPESTRKTSKAGRGIVKLKCNLINQRGEVVTESVQTAMVKTREAAE
jgi:acyl dehydratase